jgi:CheY-like chemotaxis protein
MKVFLVEDDMDDQLFFKMALTEIDPMAECVTAQHGADGLQKLMNMEEYPDLIFMDLNMPVMNGFECLKEISSSPELMDIPIIIFSTSHEEKDIVHAEKLGASGYLYKPNDNEDLISTLKEIFAVDFSDPNHPFVF